MRHRTLLMCITAAFLFSVLLHAQSDQTSLNRKAKAAQSGDRAAVTDLTDAIFDQFGWAKAANIKAHVKARLIDAEIRYKQGVHEGISEQQVVLAINRLSRDLGLPAHARTSKEQVRAVRLELIREVPGFEAGRIDQPGRAKSILASDMTPS